MYINLPPSYVKIVKYKWVDHNIKGVASMIYVPTTHADKYFVAWKPKQVMVLRYMDATSPIHL